MIWFGIYHKNETTEQARLHTFMEQSKLVHYD